MSNQRRFGVLFGLFAFVAIVAAALLLTLPKIEDQLVSDTADLLADLGVDSAEVGADGQDLSVGLPNGLPDGQTIASLTEQLNGLDGVRTLSLDVGSPPTRPAQPQATEPPAPPEPTPPEPTVIPPAFTPTPTVASPPATPVPPTPVPPTPVPPTPEPTVTSSPQPEQTPTAEPVDLDPVQVVAGIDLDEIQFRGQTASFAAGARDSLNSIADQLIELDGVNIEIQVHTDNEGDPDANLLLSQLRAEAIRDYLIRQGVDENSLTARGFGASQPIADNATDQGRQANRRVELLVVEGN